MPVPLFAVVSAIGSFFTKREETKVVKATLKAKTVMNSQKGEQKAALNEHEWSMLNKQQEDTTWKDEYVTVVFTSPIVLLVVGAVVESFTNPGVSLFDASDLVISRLNALDLTAGYGLLLSVVTFSAIGLKWKRSL